MGRVGEGGRGRELAGPEGVIHILEFFGIHSYPNPLQQLHTYIEKYCCKGLVILQQISKWRDSTSDRYI